MTLNDFIRTVRVPEDQHTDAVNRARYLMIV